MTDHDDRAQIDSLIARFFGAFDNRDGRVPTLAQIVELFVDGAIVAHDAGSQCERCCVREFAEPRVRLLAGTELVGFHEGETESATHVAGRVATRISRYRKEGTSDGRPYTGSGRKFFQLGRFAEGWRITALAWSDDA
jgi:hypothetical protein